VEEGWALLCVQVVAQIAPNSSGLQKQVSIHVPTARCRASRCVFLAPLMRESK
jgi:hypothetical protein